MKVEFIWDILIKDHLAQLLQAGYWLATPFLRVQNNKVIACYKIDFGDGT